MRAAAVTTPTEVLLAVDTGLSAYNDTGYKDTLTTTNWIDWLAAYCDSFIYPEL